MSNIPDSFITPSTKPLILCFVPHYLPGNRSGGPVRSISNLVDHLGDEYDFKIFTLDRDYLATKCYPNININSWNTVGKAAVFYSSPNILSFIFFLVLLLRSKHDILYLNSYFGLRFTFLPLFLRKIGIVHSPPCVIAPRGQFSSGALLFKSRLKQIYFTFSKFFHIFSGLHWQASSAYEESDINRFMGSISDSIITVPNLTSFLADDIIPFDSRKPGPLRIVFLSRISPKKNLHFLLTLLVSLSTDISLSIYGPTEDLDYFSHCNALASELPSNVTFSFHGHIPQQQVRNIFAQHDLFVFPSLGENFGHVIPESLSVGTPVLVSDQTPWSNGPNGGVQVLELNALLWRSTIENWATFTEKQLSDQRYAAFEYYSNYCRNDLSLDRTRSMFNDLLAYS